MSDKAAQSNESSFVELNEVSVLDLLSLEGLTIPEYQRPYMWTKENVRELFSDIDTVFEKNDVMKDFKYKYRLGSVILFKKKDEESYEVVDGQQRIITLSLIILCLNELKKSKEEDKNDISIPQIPQSVLNKESVTNIKENYSFICERINSNDIYKKKLMGILKDNIEVMQFIVSGDESIAFQLFDSQNSRGKTLYPHDLLKAHHLREMKNEKRRKMKRKFISVNSFSKRRVSLDKYYSEKWDDLCSCRTSLISIDSLFSNYLFRLYKWLRKDSALFDYQETDKELTRIYKGFSNNISYRVAKRERKASPLFKVGEPTCSGSDFFEMVFYYHSKLEKIIHSYEKKIINKKITELGKKQDNDQLNNDEQLNGIKKIFEDYSSSSTFTFTKQLFYITLLLYYDRFSQLDEKNAIKTIFAWVSVLRVKHELLRFPTVDSYATEADSLLIKINSALNHNELLDIYNEYEKEIKKANVTEKQRVFNLRKSIKQDVFKGEVVQNGTN